MTKEEKEIAKTEKKIKSVYEQASKDIEYKLNEFYMKHAAKSDIKQEQLKDGKITVDEYQSWMDGQIFQAQQWQAKKSQIAEVLYDANTIAMKMVNGQKGNLFAAGANYQAYELENGKGVNFGFGVYDSATVANLIKNEPTLLPIEDVKKHKDMAWNQKKITRQVTQGIIQGEGLDQIAKRIATEVPVQDWKEMRTHARTALTGAQNMGRYQRLMEAKEMGLDVYKEWMATLDGRTRDSHRHMDGEKQKVGDIWHPFKFSNQCRFPGDPQGPPRETYNCRCTLVGDIEGFEEEYERYDNIDGVPIKNMTYDEWAKAKSKPSIDYSKYGGKHIFDVLSKYKSFDDFMDNSSDEDFETVFDDPNIFNNTTGSPSTHVKKLYEELEKDKKAVSASTGSTEVDYSKYGGKEIYDIFSNPNNNHLHELSTSDKMKLIEAYNKGEIEHIPGKTMGEVFDQYFKEAHQQPSTGAGQVDYSKYGGKEIFDILSKFKYGDDFIFKSTAEEYEKVWKAFGGDITDESLKKAYKNIEEDKKILSGAKKANSTAIDYSKYGGKEIYDIIVNSNATSVNSLYSKVSSDDYTKVAQAFGFDHTAMNKAIEEIQKPIKEAELKKKEAEAKKKEAEAKKKEAELKKAVDKVTDLSKKVKDKGADKIFSDIWKDQDVTYEDWESKKGSIQAKKDYYNEKIPELEAKGTKLSLKAAEIAKKKLADLEEFEKHGAEYSALLKQLKEAKKVVKDLSPSTGAFDSDAYTQERKDNAVWAKSSKQADKVLRDKCGEVWRNASYEEKDAIFEYTQSYHKYNEPLRGIEYGTSEYKGVGNTDLNARYADNGARLNAMTDIIDKSTYDEDIWLQRGCRFDGMDKFFGVDEDLLYNGTQEQLEDALLGTTPTEYGFMSCGSSKGSGFSGDILLNVYAPSGTKMMYVEPFSAFGYSSEYKNWDGVSTQYGFGTELETILQQGTQFRITKIERQGTYGTIYVDLEVIDQSKQQRWEG